jgi:hypothetical protein
MKPIKIEIEIFSEETAIISVDGKRYSVDRVYRNSIEDAEEKNVQLYNYATRNLDSPVTGNGYTDAEYTFGGIWLRTFNDVIPKTLDAVGYLNSVAPDSSAWSELDESSKFMVEYTLTEDEDDDSIEFPNSIVFLNKHNEKTN